MDTLPANPPPRPASPLAGIEEGMRADELESLGFLRRCGCNIAEKLDRHASGLLLFREQPAFEGVDVALAFSRVAKAVRQIVVLEQETAGVRPMPVRREAAEVAASAEASDLDALKAGEADATRPERSEPRELPDEDDLRDPDDTDDYDDYAELRSGTLEQAIARIAADLGALPGAALVKMEMAAELAKADMPEATPPAAETPEPSSDTLAKSADAEQPRPKHGRDPP